MNIGKVCVTCDANSVSDLVLFLLTLPELALFCTALSSCLPVTWPPWVWKMGESQLNALAVQQCFWHCQVQAGGQDSFSCEIPVSVQT